MQDKHKIIDEVLCSLSSLKQIDDKKMFYKIKGNIKKLEKIYHSGFRHQYSEIFKILSRINDDSKKELSVDQLSETICVLFEFAKKGVMFMILVGSCVAKHLQSSTIIENIIKSIVIII
ncbi:hypothetical protein [Campylobacter corcagiensis]|uniref:Uncharacterized protein n=1 Tax=Campylobacter corcagiensis TaxID=1448857 RepID=A0A7M1LGG4_9BACT|nr:hypothetical protein [Campylobacter corcagiensis]QOQ87692.1 hypothetical protein IMC76_02450 [Campylobacter corcagiensis]